MTTYTPPPEPGRTASRRHLLGPLAGICRTGREALSLAAITIGLPRSRVDEMLDLVGLTAEEAGRRVGNYSLGSA